MPRGIVFLLFVACFATTTGAFAQEECDGPFKGKTPTDEQLSEVLANHLAWLEIPYGDERRAKDGDEGRANLCEAWLRSAELSEANLSGANLSGVILINANLRGANLNRANLRGARLDSAILINAILPVANLNGANLAKTNLSEAYLYGADLSQASLVETNLNGANLVTTNLSGSFLAGADLSGAYLREANLSGATLDNPSLEGASMRSAILTGAIYEPSTAPASGQLSNLQGVTTVTFRVGKHSGLVQLRDAFRAGGIRRLEREATYALNHGITKHAFNGWRDEEDQQDGILKRLFTEPLPIFEGVFRTLLFEWPTGWGLYYGRPVKILFSLVFLMSFVHLIPLLRGTSKVGSAGIYRVWPKGRIVDNADKYETAEDEIVERLQLKGWSAIGFALYFSLLSAFQIGWRDLNVGSWIARLQSREYFLRGRGWVRTVSGAQSLVSVYLLAMWVLTYFGRPFD